MHTKLISPYRDRKEKRMKKLFTRAAAIIMGISMAAGVGVAIAAHGKEAATVDAEASYAFSGNKVTFANQGLSNDTQYPNDFTNAASDNTFKVNFTGGGNDGKYYTTGSGIRTYGGGNVNVYALNDKVLTQVIFTFSGSSYAAPSNLISGYTLNSAVGTWTGSASSITLTRASGSGHWRLQSVQATVSDGGGEDTPTLSSIAIKTAPTKLSYTEGDHFDPTGLVITRTYSNDDTDDLSYANNESAFSFTPATNVALKTTDTSVEITHDGKTCEQAITLAAGAPGKDYTLCTSTSDLVVGSSYIITSGTSGTVSAMSTESNDNNRRTTSVTVNNNTITASYTTLSFTLGGSTGAWTFLTENYTGTNGYFAPGTGKNNHLKIVTEANKDTCSIEFSSNVATITFTSNSDGRNKLRYNSGNSLFACYSSGQDDIYLWKEADSSTATLESISIEGNLETTTYTVGDTVSTAGLSVVGHYDDESTKSLAATITANPTTLNTIGESIKVTFSATYGEFNDSVDKYVKVNDVTVTPISSFYDGTIEVGQTATENTYYIQGTVIAIESNSYYIQDGQYGLLVYGGRVAPATGMKIGDLVRIQSKVINYKGYVMETSGIVGDPTCTIMGTGNLPAAPVVTTVAQLEAANQSTRITFNGLKLSGSSITWTSTWSQGGSGSNGVATVKDGNGGDVTIYVSKYLDETTGAAIVSKLGQVTSVDTFDLFQTVKAINTTNGAIQVSISSADQVVIHVPEEDPIIGWIDSYMEMDNPAFDGDGTMMCKDQSYYVNAKAALKALEEVHEGSIAKFEANADGDYTDALARYKAWAKACGDQTPFDGEATIVNAIYVPNSNIGNGNGNMIAIIVIASIALVATTGAVTAIIIKKRATH